MTQTPHKQTIIPKESTIKSLLSENFLTDPTLCLDFRQEFASRLTQQREVHLVLSPALALRSALDLLEMKPGEEIFCPIYWQPEYMQCLQEMHLQPIPLGITRHNMAIDPMMLERALKQRAATGAPLPRAVIVAHAHGIPADMPALCRLGERYRLTIIEDCTQALGSSIEGRSVGSWGQISFFSLVGDSLIVCGCGGVVSWSEQRTLTREGPYQTWSQQAIEYTMRRLQPLPPLIASVARPQLAHLDENITRRRLFAKLYQQGLGQVMGLRALRWSDDSYAPNGSCIPIYIEPDTLQFSCTTLLDRLVERGFHATRPILQLIAPIEETLYEETLYPSGGVAMSMAEQILYLPNDISLAGVEILAVIEEIRHLVLEYNS